MVKEKVLLFANHINGTKVGSKKGIKPEDPEYYILEPVVSEEMAEVGMCLEVRKPASAEEVALKCGLTVAETTKRLDELAEAGVCMVSVIDGVDKYMVPIWVPGIMEMMVANNANAEKYPQIPRAFEEYTRIRIAPLVGNLPIGKGVMRVIPIEKAIDGETRRASYEEVSHYLNENEVFSVSDCSCRKSRRIMGEGCGHLEKDMCIQLGQAAEYYIRTGKGRKISREEAFDIIKRAEENGLFHQIPNTDGSGHTHAICNCCVCSCFSMRTAAYFHEPNLIRSNYVSQVDKDKCVACGQCVEYCPTNAVRLGQKLCSNKPVSADSRLKKHPDAYSVEWKADKWNPDFRTNRQDVVESGTSPCKTDCPAHIGIQGYIKKAAEGKYREALELIKKENPFPAVCGRICPRKCESACTRGDIDDPVAIDEIKKFIADQDMNADRRYVPELRHRYGKKIAVVGSGPAGLGCAYFLAIDGYKVTVFEKQKALGGMLTLGIPSFRLEKNVVNAEIDILKELGVEFKTGVEVGKDVGLKDLRSQGYEAFYLAIGAQAGRRIGIEGEEAEGVIAGVDFVRDVNLGKELKLDGTVLVIGGGNVAIDVARTAARVGAKSVEMFCLESRAEMPALPEEIEEAMAEGIRIDNSWGPKRIVAKNGRVVGVEFKKCVSVFDAEKRFNPKYDESVTKLVEADYVLTSIGQSIDWGDLLAGSKIELNRNNTVKADPFTYQTGEPDVFAGGDAYTGPKFAIDAIAAGKEAAISIHRFVQPGQSLVLGRDKREYRALDKGELDLEGYDRSPRQKAGRDSGGARKDSFRDERATFTEEQLKKETERCLGCGAVIVDANMCVGCGMCTTRCKFDAISLARRFDEHGVVYEKLIPSVLPYILKRQGNVAIHKLFKSAKAT
jgi:NADPH-dependent glutamate synthase beta subunit-like oxidoreductase/NAD-dependent dihydropyrimidine dehydrogenase PreA subunit